MVVPISKKKTDEEELLKKYPPPEIDPHPDRHGVLLSDEIIYYAVNHNLIWPFNPRNLKPAAYELTVGRDYFLGGEFLTLNPDDPEKNTIVIPPFEVAVIQTHERVCIPRFLIARWNIRVKHAYSGLLWVGGPQVDPGYVGHLFCPLYNLSDTEVRLKAGDEIAVIDFVKTTPFDRSKPDTELLRYGLTKRPILESFAIENLRSALFTHAGQKIAEFDESVSRIESRFSVFTQISFAISALMIAVLTVAVSMKNHEMPLGIASWGVLSIFLSVWALLVSFLSFVSRRVGHLFIEQYGRFFGDRAKEVLKFVKRSWWSGVVFCCFASLATAFLAYYVIAGSLTDVYTQGFVAKSDLEAVGKETDSLKSRLQSVEVSPATRQELIQTRQEFIQLRQDLQRQLDALKQESRPQSPPAPQASRGATAREGQKSVLPAQPR